MKKSAKKDSGGGRGNRDLRGGKKKHPYQKRITDSIFFALDMEEKGLGKKGGWRRKKKGWVKGELSEQPPRGEERRKGEEGWLKKTRV